MLARLKRTAIPVSARKRAATSLTTGLRLAAADTVNVPVAFPAADDGAVHVNFADPYCPVGRETVRQTASAHDLPLTDGGTMVVVDGPRFSTRAESRWFTAMGGAIVNMTGHPEAVLARELALCYTSIALVTDLDAGVEGDQGVTQDEVFRVFAENTDRLRALLLDVVAALPVDPDCGCRSALDGLTLPVTLP